MASRPSGLEDAPMEKEAQVGLLTLCPEDIDTDCHGTFDVSARGRSRDNWQPMRVEPAWFVPREKSLTRLSRRLLSEASPLSGADNKTKTFRLAAILDGKPGPCTWCRYSLATS